VEKSKSLTWTWNDGKSDRQVKLERTEAEESSESHEVEKSGKRLRDQDITEN
jgi:hypothetical protein